MLARILQYLTVVNYHTESPYLCIQHSGRVSGHLTAHKHYVKLFSPSGKLARMAIYFACVNFFFFYYEQSYLSMYSTNFHDLFTKWKVFASIFIIWSSFSNFSKDVAMATNLVLHRIVRSEPKYLRIRWLDFHNLCTVW